MSKLKTQPTDAPISAFIETLGHKRKIKEAHQVLGLMKKVTGLDPKMWGPSIIGFGTTRYKYESGHEGKAPTIAFSPRKPKIVMYVLNNFEGQEDLLATLGKYKTGKVCLYINKLADVDLEVLEEIVKQSWLKEIRKK